MKGFKMQLALLGCLTTSHLFALPFLSGNIDKDDLPNPVGVSLEILSMNQDYKISNLSFNLPGANFGNPAGIQVDSELTSQSIKFDTWIFPFLNVFAVAGHMKGNTNVDITQANFTIGGQAVPIDNVSFSSEGQALTGGLTLGYATKNWFTTLTATYTESDDSGDINSKFKVKTIQPRVGLIRDNWRFFIGGWNQDSDEDHRGIIRHPVLNALGINGVNFNAQFIESDDWHYLVGAHYSFSKSFELGFEAGLGEREHTLLNLTYRF